MPARAADLPSAAAGAAAYDWSGFYLGGTAGVAWGSLGLKTSTPFTRAYFPDTATQGAVNAAGAQTIKPHGIPIGLEAGYNWQAPRSPWVLGIEADMQSLRLSGGVQSGPVSYPGFRARFSLSVPPPAPTGCSPCARGLASLSIAGCSTPPAASR